MDVQVNLPNTKVDPQTALANALQPNYERTHAGSAKLLASLFKGQLYFSPTYGWLYWKDGHWNFQDESQMLQFALETAKERKRRSTYSTSQEAERKYAIRSQNYSSLQGTIRIAKGLPELRADDSKWDSDPYLFGVANGVVDLLTGQLREERPEDFILHHSPVKFDPNATCPRFEQFLKEIFGNDPDLISYVQRAIGYTLTGDISEQVLFACYGNGANGKSTLLNALSKVFGEYHANLPFTALELSMRGSSTNDLSSLPNKRFVTASESSIEQRFNEARIKALTGGDEITARRLYHEAFTFEPTQKIWLSFNNRPIIKDNSDAIWRRIHMVPFLKQFSGKAADLQLIEKLESEGPGILNWAVEGCRNWKRDGLKPPEIVLRATAEYREDQDEIGEFLSACFYVGPDKYTSVAEVWGAYVDWCKFERRNTMGRQAFNEQLEQRGFKRKHAGHNRMRVWIGLSLIAGVQTGEVQANASEQSKLFYPKPN